MLNSRKSPFEILVVIKLVAMAVLYALWALNGVEIPAGEVTATCRMQKIDKEVAQNETEYRTETGDETCPSKLIR